MNIFTALTLALTILFPSFTTAAAPTTNMPPSFPSSSYAFTQIAQPTTANQAVNPADIPCFQAYSLLQQQLHYPSSSSDYTSLITTLQNTVASSTPTQLQTFVQDTNTKFLAWEAALVTNAQNTTSPTSYN